MMMMMMMLNVIQMSASLPIFLSTVTYYISAVGDIIVQLYVHTVLYADVIVNWLLTNILMYVSRHVDIFIHKFIYLFILFVICCKAQHFYITFIHCFSKKGPTTLSIVIFKRINRF